MWTVVFPCGSRQTQRIPVIPLVHRHEAGFPWFVFFDSTEQRHSQRLGAPHAPQVLGGVGRSQKGKRRRN